MFRTIRRGIVIIIARLRAIFGVEIMQRMQHQEQPQQERAICTSATSHRPGKFKTLERNDAEMSVRLPTSPNDEDTPLSRLLNRYRQSTSAPEAEARASVRACVEASGADDDREPTPSQAIVSLYPQSSWSPAPSHSIRASAVSRIRQSPEEPFNIPPSSVSQPSLELLSSARSSLIQFIQASPSEDNIPDIRPPDYDPIRLPKYRHISQNDRRRRYPDLMTSRLSGGLGFYGHTSSPLASLYHRNPDLEAGPGDPLPGEDQDAWDILERHQQDAAVSLTLVMMTVCVLIWITILVTYGGGDNLPDETAWRHPPFSEDHGGGGGGIEWSAGNVGN